MKMRKCVLQMLFIVVERTVHSATTFKPTSPSDSHTEYAVTSYSVMVPYKINTRPQTSDSYTEYEIDNGSARNVCLKRLVVCVLYHHVLFFHKSIAGTSEI